MKIEIIIILITGIYTALNFFAFLNNVFLFKNKKDYSEKNNILVIVSHQDDETIAAGGLIYKTIKKGGNVKVAFTADGITREESKKNEEIKKEIEIRNRESINALKSLGVKEKNIIFLNNENEKALQKKENINETINKIIRIIKEYEPDKIVTCAFEGGHCDHDATNYVVSKASKKLGLKKEQILEAPEYNRFYLCESIRHRINKFLIIKFEVPPKFIKGNNKSSTLYMTKEELEAKINAFKHYKSQNPNSLIKRFGFPDQHRIKEDYNYRKGPFDPKKSIRYKLCLLFKKNKNKCSSFFCGLTYNDYIKIYNELEDEIK